MFPDAELVVAVVTVFTFTTPIEGGTVTDVLLGAISMVLTFALDNESTIRFWCEALALDCLWSFNISCKHFSADSIRTMRSFNSTEDWLTHWLLVNASSFSSIEIRETASCSLVSSILIFLSKLTNVGRAGGVGAGGVFVEEVEMRLDVDELVDVCCSC